VEVRHQDDAHGRHAQSSHRPEPRAPSLRPAPRVNDPSIVRREYAREDRFLARRLANEADLEGPLVEDAAIAAVAEVAPERVVDVGCGTGDLTERLAREAEGPVVAVDLSPRMAELARGRGLPAINADIERLPFPDGAFDAVLANRVLYHLPDLDAGLAELARVLRPGGRLVAVVYRIDHLAELWDVVGHQPLANPTFVAENGGEPLRRHFEPVERRDVTGIARFRSGTAVHRLLGAYGDFSEVDLAAALGDRAAPLQATYRHTVFVAWRP
jgi:SAM-dependent methyltransferase